MRIRKYIFWILSLSGLMLLSFTYGSRTYQTECVTLETAGYVTLKIWDPNKGASYKPEQARKDAIHAILYSGVTGGTSCGTQPPLLNQLEEQASFTAIEKSFFTKNGKWAVYSRSSETETTLPANIGKKKWKVYQVTISKDELRRYLEDQKIIKSLSNGF